MMTATNMTKFMMLSTALWGSATAFTPHLTPKVSRVVLSPEDGTTTELSVAGAWSLPQAFPSNGTMMMTDYYTAAASSDGYLSSWEEALMQQDFGLSKFPKWDACVKYLHDFARSKRHPEVQEPANAYMMSQEIHLVDLPWLKPHEQVVSETAVDNLVQATLQWGAYVSPLLVDRVTGAILDGHHRFQVACRLGLKRVPAVLVDYVDDHSITVDVWDGCGKDSLTKSEVLEMSLSPHVFPPKTSKHSFSDTLPPILVPLTSLQTDIIHTSDSGTLDYHI